MLSAGARLRLWLNKANASSHHFRRGISADFEPRWQVDESVPGFKPLWSRIQVSDKPTVDIVEEWKHEGNQVSKGLMSNVISKLCSRGRYPVASKLVKWLDEGKSYELTEEDELTRLAIASRLRKVGSKFKKLSESFQHKSEASYILVLKAYTNELQVGQAKQVFKELKESKLMVTGRAYMHMLRMYVRLRKQGQALKVWEEFKASGLPDDPNIYWLLVKNRDMFSSLPVEEMARTTLEKLEVTPANRKDVMKLYTYLGDFEAADKMWEQMQDNPPIANSEFLTAISCYDIIGNVEKAEEISNEYAGKFEGDEISYQHEMSMLRLYARHGMVDKAEERQKKLEARKVHFEQVHPIIDAYLKQGDLEKATKCFHTYMSRKCHYRMPFNLVVDSVVKLNKEFALTGDVKNAEQLMATAPNLHSVSAYKSLMKVYLAAKVPAYGLLDRMRAANIELDDEAEMLLKQLSVFEVVIDDNDTESNI